MILKSLFEFELNFLEVRNEGFLVGHDHTFLLLLVKTVLIYLLSEFLLLFEPAISTGIDPLVQVVLGLSIRLHEDIVFVKL